MVKVSVIIPVYNAEKYIGECIETLLAQTLEDCEFIFVNDGSIDSSLEILKSYKQKDHRIHIINQINKGVSAARNSGIAYAKGLFLGFVDSDDFISNDYFQILYSAAMQFEVSIVSSNFVFQNDGQFSNQKSFFDTNKVFDKTFIKEKILPFLIQQDDLNSCCTKLFKRSLITENNISFPITLTHAEDASFVLQSFVKANNVVFLNYLGYFYQEVNESATRSILTKDFFHKALDVFSIDYNKEYDLQLNDENIKKLKAARLITTSLSIIYIYLKPNSPLSFLKKYHYVKKIINAIEVQNAIENHWDALTQNKSKYNVFVIKAIRDRSMLRLLFATHYSYFRNSK